MCCYSPPVIQKGELKVKSSTVYQTLSLAMISLVQNIDVHF